VAAPTAAGPGWAARSQRARGPCDLLPADTGPRALPVRRGGLPRAAGRPRAPAPVAIRCAEPGLLREPGVRPRDLALPDPADATARELPGLGDQRHVPGRDRRRGLDRLAGHRVVPSRRRAAPGVGAGFRVGW